MTPLERVFERTVPGLLEGKARSAGSIGFAATGAPETGYWVLDLNDGSCRRGEERDAPGVVIEASAAAFTLLFSGGLDVPGAIDSGALVIRGDEQLVSRLGEVLSS